MTGRVYRFANGQVPVAHLVQVCATDPVRLPLHAGITFIGRQASACEFEGRACLSGVVEGAQILVRWDETGCWVTDASSTNPTRLVRAGSEDRLLPQERFETAIEERRWVQVFPGDLLVHAYASWTVVEV